MDGLAINHNLLSPGHLESIAEKGKDRKITVVGDLMLDRWIMGTVTRISPEAPVPIVKVLKRKEAAGGAANVALNLAALGAQVSVVGVVGQDSAGHNLIRVLKERGVETRGILIHPTMTTPIKERVVAGGQQMVRLDYEEVLPRLDNRTIEQLSANIGGVSQNAACLCFSDYGKGVLNVKSWAPYVELLPANVKLVGGPKPANVSKVADLYIEFISLNESEARKTLGLSEDTALGGHEIQDAVRRLMQLSGANRVAVTCGGRGVAMGKKDSPITFFPSHNVEVYDVVGAGDTFLASATFALASGTTPEKAVALGNLAAAWSVRHHGVVAPSFEDILHELKTQS